MSAMLLSKTSLSQGMFVIIFCPCTQFVFEYCTEKFGQSGADHDNAVISHKVAVSSFRQWLDPILLTCSMATM